MSDVFISYSRKDKDFTRRLIEALNQHNFEPWIDWEDIPPTSDWQLEIRSGIESADNFLFIISPESLRSTVCQQELDYAVGLSKRIIPVQVRDVDPSEAPPALTSHTWLHFHPDDNFDSAFNQLVSVLTRDLEHTRAHTRLTIRAREWEASRMDASFLLRGADLQQAEMWLASGLSKTPLPTSLQSRYIFASRQASERRQRSILIIAGAALVSVALLAVAAIAQTLRANELAQQMAANGTPTPDSSALWIMIIGLAGVFVVSNGVTFYVSRRRSPELPAAPPQPLPPKTTVKISQHTFLSYSRIDKDVMLNLEKDLNEKEIPTWTDEDLEPGTEEWERSVERAIKTAGCLVVLLSPDSNESKWVRREITFAEEFSVRVFPVLIRGDARSSIPARLINHERIDLRERGQYGPGLERLLEGIVNHLTTKDFQERIADAS